MRLLIYIILFFLLYLLVRAFLFPKKDIKGRGNERLIDGGEMVFDPVCQSYFPKNEALSIKDGEKAVYFCSKECREKFLKKQ
jgi:YHS domain-containing protein